jgi:death-on-curing family protein
LHQNGFQDVSLPELQSSQTAVSLIANAAPTQPGLLDSTVASPMNVKHYSGQSNLFQLAANFSEKIMKNHAFQDGNKRAALVAADMFLKINGCPASANRIG